MQSGTIKHWNADKAYGFIDVDHQSEDVFFHVSNVQLSQPLSVGQRVYFNSARNEKNQLNATEVTTTPPKTVGNRTPNRQNQSQNRQTKNSWITTIFSILGLLLVVYFGANTLPDKWASDEPETASTSQTTSATDITGDAQIDQTIALIQQGGPFPYPDKDGTTFYNRENRLPAQSSGYYREYTVPTSGISHRGAKRIVTGGTPPTVYYLTLDHYESFSKLEVN